jgi:hypothetical protein
MSKTPPEELVLTARKLDPDFHAQIVGPWKDTEPWRAGVPGSLKKIWGKLDYSERLVIFVLLLGGHDDDEPATPWRFALDDRVRFTTDVVVTVSQIMPNDPNPSSTLGDVPAGTEGVVILVENRQMIVQAFELAGTDPDSTTIVYLRDDYCLERA